MKGSIYLTKINICADFLDYIEYMQCTSRTPKSLPEIITHKG
jgi:hypothetical protein